MSKLFGLKSWLTLDEAASFLSGTLQEPVTVPDLLRLALDGHLVLSANFVNGTTVNLGERKNWDDARLVLFPALFQNEPLTLEPELAALLEEFPKRGTRQEQHEWLLSNREIADHPKIVIFISGDRISEDSVLEWKKEIESIQGVWDLPNSGGAILDVEHLLQSLVSGVEVTGTCLDGTFVVSRDGQTYARLLEHFGNNPYIKEKENIQDQITRVRKYPYGDPNSYYPRGGLPDDAPIVVRPAALTDFLAVVAGGVGETDALIEKPLEERERASMLRIIRALDVMAKLPPRGAATSIEAQLQKMGFSKPSEATIRKVIEQARALEPNKPQ
ncbi:MAG: hypothetical protein V4673_15405 [Pseudomonadota bacterium]